MSVTWAAPGRVNLIGEHTDYNDGFVLPFALPQRTVVTATALDEPIWRVTSNGETVEFDLSEPVTGWAQYVAGIVWVLTSAGHRVPGADLQISSDVPLGAGLSSSAALESAVLAALVDLGRLDLPQTLWPALAQRAENEYVGMPCGIMDQSASILSHAGHALFLDCRSQEIEYVPFDLDADGLTILVTDTNAPHRLVTGEYATRRRSCEQAAAQLGVPALRDATLDAVERLEDPVLRRRARHVVTENQRVLDTVALLKDGKPRDIGTLMVESHISLRDDFEVTVPELDLAVEISLASGAHGARMTGGGFGGCVLSLIDIDAMGAVSEAIHSAFMARGFEAPTGFTALASAGAHRLH